LLQTNSKEFTLAISSVLEAGKIVRDIYNTSFEVSWKAKDDPLTEADLQANKLILDRLQSAFPGDAFLSEEIADNTDRLTKDRVWILDPIDGTREFVQKNPEFSISLGLAVQGKAVLGVVFNPITKELMIGIVGLGVSYKILNDEFEIESSKIELKPIEFMDVNEKPSAYVSRSEFSKYKLFDTNPYWKNTFTLKPVGSIAYKLALTSVNKGDLSISLKPKSEWDICAGVALILASGGLAFDLANLEEFPFNSKIPRQRGILAGNPTLVKSIISEKGDFFRNSITDWT
jgi:myo-inositol-1(or 4)-monophosphatase